MSTTKNLNSRETIQSWMGIYKTRATVLTVTNSEQLKIAEELKAFPVGKLHTYNDKCMHPVVVKFEGEYDFIRLNKDSVTFGPGATIQEVMDYCMKSGKILPMSGNHRKQTLIGAVLGGTHGFGENFYMSDYIVDQKWMGRYCVSMTLKTIPATSYKISSCTCRLKSLSIPDEGKVSWLILPYSRELVTLTSTFTPTANETQPISPSREKWGRLRLWWAIDHKFPWLRKFIQRKLDFLNITWESTTSWKDVDALYHPWPNSDKGEKFLLWMYKPTYTCHNMALMVSSSEIKSFIRSIIDISNLLDKDLLRCFIGVRFDTKRGIASVDMYCSPDKAWTMQELQFRLQALYLVNFHKSKSFQ